MAHAGPADAGSFDHARLHRYAGQVPRASPTPLPLFPLPMQIEAIGGYLAHSVAIMSDAAHMLSESLGSIAPCLRLYSVCLFVKRGAWRPTHTLSRPRMLASNH